VCDLETSRMGAPYIYDISRLRVKVLRTCARMCKKVQDGAKRTHVFEIGSTSERYVEMLRNFRRPQLRSLRVNMEEMWFQQDGATAHTASASMTVVRQMFPQHVVSRFGDVPWPPRSPHLSACNFFLWGYLKSKVYVRKPRTVDDLQVSIHEEIATVPQEMLVNVMQNSGRVYGKKDAIFPI